VKDPRAAQLTVANVDDSKLALISQEATPEGARNGVVTKDGRLYLALSSLGQVPGLIIALPGT